MNEDEFRKAMGMPAKAADSAEADELSYREWCDKTLALVRFFLAQKPDSGVEPLKAQMALAEAQAGMLLLTEMEQKHGNDIFSYESKAVALIAAACRCIRNQASTSEKCIHVGMLFRGGLGGFLSGL